MLVCVRTTINLPAALAEAAKAKAVAEGRTFTSLVEEGLRNVIDARSEPPAAATRLPVSGRAGGRPLVDLEDHDALWEALDADGVR